MEYPPIPRADKGRLRWEYETGRWRWVRPGPRLTVTVLANGRWQVNRSRL